MTVRAKFDPSELASLEFARLLGYQEVPEVAEEVAPALDRGRPLVLWAGEGSGHELVYAMAALARCDPQRPSTQALVLTATEEAAVRAARAVALVSTGHGIEVRVHGTEIRRSAAPHLLAGLPSAVLADVRAGRLSVGEPELLIVDGAEAIQEAGGWEATEILLDAARSSQKILRALRSTDELQAWIERRMPRAWRWPTESALPKAGGSAAASDALWYAVGATEQARADALAASLGHFLSGSEGRRASVRCLSEEEARATAAHLVARGLSASRGAREGDVVVSAGAPVSPAESDPQDVVALTWLPVRSETLRRQFETARTRLLVVEPIAVPQAILLTARAGWHARETPATFPRRQRDRIARFREDVWKEAQSFDSDAEILLLEPLLKELGALRVAAALTRLLRRRSGVPELEEPSAELESAWTRLRLNVGRRDGVGPGDIVGAITGETPAAGAQIGRIEIRNSFSLVEVDSQIAAAVIQGLSGKRIRAREVSVRREVRG